MAVRPHTARTTRGRQVPAEELAAGEFADSPCRLGIIVGHTRAQPGAWGVPPIACHEYPWHSRLAVRIATEATLRRVSHRVIYRDGIGIAGAYRAAEGWNATLIVELHFNSANTKARGTETLHGTSAASKRWAEVMQAHMARLYRRLGKTNRGLKLRRPGERGGASLNALPDIPTCLIEPFFGDNPADAALGQSRKPELARCIVEAALAFTEPSATEKS